MSSISKKMYDIKDELIEGYYSIKAGEYTFREWIKKNITQENYPDSLIEYHFDKDASIEIGRRILELEFEKHGITWPANTENEVAILEKLFLKKYNEFKISGVELVGKCSSISDSFNGETKYYKIWKMIEEDLLFLDFGEENGRFILTGNDVETEIEDCLIRNGAISHKRLIQE